MLGPLTFVQKNPSQLEAIKWDGSEESAEAVKSYVTNYADEVLIKMTQGRIYIKRASGWFTVRPGDYAWIHDGRVAVGKGQVFEQNWKVL